MIETVKKALRLFEPSQRRFLPVLFLLMLVGSAFEVVGVSMIVPLIAVMMSPDALGGSGKAARLLAIIPEFIREDFVSNGIAILIAIFVVKTIFLTFENWVQRRFVYQNRFRLQRRLLASYLSRPYEYFLKVRTGELLRVINSDVAVAFDLVNTLLLISTELTVSIVLVITIFAISPLMTVFIACALVLTTLFITGFLRSVMRDLGRRRNRMLTQANKWLLQSIHGIKEIKISRREGFFERNFLTYGREGAEVDQRQAVLQGIPRQLIEMVSVCSMLAVIVVMTKRGATADELIPELSAFAMAAVKLMPSANRISNSLNKVAYSTHSLDKVLDNLVAIEGEDDSWRLDEDNVTPLPFEHELRLDGVSYRYPSAESDVLSNATLVVGKGESVGIMGPSGAGKTTTVDIMLGLLEPREGGVLLDGVDVRENYAGWLAHVGYIPQTIFMLDDTIGANVVFGHEYDEDRIWEALEEAQLAEFVRGLPDGLDTQMGERGVRLSGGQRQRIGIARALYGNPDVLFFDEATSSLDNETEQGVMDAVYRLKGKRTIVIIAHRLSTIEHCDHVFEVNDGKITRQR